jgi:hypothetical protein
MKEIENNDLSDAIINLSEIRFLLELLMIYISETFIPNDITPALSILLDKTDETKAILEKVDV